MIKQPFLLTIALSLLFTTASAEAERKVKSEITHVTVFMQGAQVTRKGSVSIPKGHSYLLFEGVSPHTQQQSIKASGKGKFTIMDVQFRHQYPKPEEVDKGKQSALQKKINQLSDSISWMNRRIQNVQEKLNAIQTERRVFLSHPILKGEGKKDSLPLFIGTMDYMEKYLEGLADRHLKRSNELAELNLVLKEMNTRLRNWRNYQQNESRPKSTNPVYQIVVSVYSKSALNGTVEVNYKVNQAGWSPWYDITAKDAGDDVSLEYKAAIYQNTGEDWKNVKLRISNANPNQSNTKPILPKWYINYYEFINKPRNSTTRSIEETKYLRKKEDMLDEERDEVYSNSGSSVSSTMAADFSKKIQNFSSVEFDIDLPYHILSNGKTHFVTVDKHILKAEFKHYLVPKMDKDAFVVARIVDWENLDLLVGNANIYFGNTFIGRTVIDPTVVLDTLEVSMGRYRSMAVKRTKLKDDTKNQVIGGNKVYKATYKIELRNNSGNPIDLVLEDHLPITTNEEIEIELVEANGGVLNEASGVISWDFKLEAYQKETIQFTYTVRYSKDKTISGL